MVDALSEIHRVLAPGGILIDARPDSRVLAYVERAKSRGARRFGIVNTRSSELVIDRASDRAIETVVRNGLFRRYRSGRFWFQIPFDDLPAVRQYLWEHMRFVRRAKWVVDAATRRRYSNERFVIRRAARFELLERVNR